MLNKVNKIVYMGLLIALEVVLTRFLSIQTPIIRVSFGFLPIAAAGIMFGPIFAGMLAAIADILGMIIFPKGAYFPGFTLSAFVSGVIYGVLLCKNSMSVVRTGMAVGLIMVFVDLIMNTYWLTIITGKAAEVLLAPRLMKLAIMFPIQTILIYTLWRTVNKLEFIPKLYKL